MIESVPNLSTRCPKCGDRASMPAVSVPYIVFKRPASGHGSRNVFVSLHTCPNEKCSGAVIGYYDGPWENLRCFHQVPKFNRYVVSMEVEDRPRQLLQDANDASNAPTAACAVATKAVEAMLADKGFSERRIGLKGRIEKAVKEGVLPQIMADWAEEVRGIGNSTHTDEEPEPLPTKDDAERSLKFANLLAEYLYVLPAEIKAARAPKEGNGEEN